MADEDVFSPGTGTLSDSQHLSFTMEEGSAQSEDLPEIAGEDDSGQENEYDELVSGGEPMLEFQGIGLENAGQQSFTLDSNNLENLNHQLFEIECNDSKNYNEQMLEIEENGDEIGDINMLEVEANSLRNSYAHTLENGSGDQEVNDSQGQSAVMDDGQSSSMPGMQNHPPVVGMGFESYDDAYNYYNCYAKELGFAIRVKSSWTKRYSKEKRGAVLCCNCEGFKTVKEATVRRKETRTGCSAMLRIRLAESNRWRVDEVKLDHNHPFDPRRAKSSKSHRRIEEEANKRKFELDPDVEVRTIKLYRTPNDVTDLGAQKNSGNERGGGESQLKSLKLKGCDIQAIHDFFCKLQLASPNFLYLMDLNDKGQLRNVFWIDSRSRAAYGYFGDVIAIDTTCLSNDFEIPLLAFVGINHHGDSIPLGCGLLADQTMETFVWIFRAWITCMLGRPPQTIITDQSKAMQNAISEIFPRAHHRLCLQLVMQSIYRNLGTLLHESEALHTVLHRTVYGYLKVDEFESSWECMVSQFGIKDFDWVQRLYKDRGRWAPVYLKDTFLAGFAISQLADESMVPFFSDHLHKKTSLKEFFDIYDSVLQKKYQKETLADLESTETISASLRTGCSYELQLSKLYTKSIFRKFQTEVEAMSSCISISQIHSSGPTTTYMIKEQNVGGNPRGDDYRNFEVVYDHTTVEVRCGCGCFQLNGYLCRHALCTLNYNGIQEIPSHYILSRWRRNRKHLYVTDFGLNTAIDVSNPLQRHDHLYRKVTQIVEEGMVSQGHYMVAWQAFKESLNKVRLAGDQEKNVRIG